MPRITDLPTDTAPATDDLVPFVDVSASRTEAVTVDNLAASAAFTGRYVSVPTAWTAVSGGVGFQNSWVDFGGAFPTAQYRKVGDVVSIRGLVKSGASNTTIFTLPVGFRPPLDIYAPGVASDMFANLVIESDGEVKIVGTTSSWAALTTTFSVTA